MAMQTATATFDGTQDTVALTWPAMTGAFGINASVTVTDGSGAVAPWLTNRSSGGATVNVSSRFSGTVELNLWDKP